MKLRKIIRKNKKGSGVVGSLVGGTIGLVILAVVGLLIVATLLDANLFGNDSSTTTTVSNETLAGEEGAWLNKTTYTLSIASATRRSFSIVSIYNLTGGTPLNSSQWSANSITGVIQNGTNTEYGNVTITYTYTDIDSTTKDTAGNLSGNLSAGINEVALKIPTILKIAAIVILIGVVVFLAQRAKPAMMINGESSSL